MDEAYSFGECVLRRRQALDHTRASLAAAIGILPETIKKIERDERRPSQQVVELFADQLHIRDNAQDPGLRDFAEHLLLPLHRKLLLHYCGGGDEHHMLAHILLCLPLRGRPKGPVAHDHRRFQWCSGVDYRLFSIHRAFLYHQVGL